MAVQAVITRNNPRGISNGIPDLDFDVSETRHRGKFSWLPKRAESDVKEKVKEILNSNEGSSEAERKRKAVIRVQSIYRGYVTRREMQRLYRASNLISEPSFVEVMKELGAMQNGWDKFICHIILWLVAVLAVQLSLAHGEPNIFNQENALTTAMQGVRFGPFDDDYFGVQNLDDLKEYVYAFIEDLSRIDPNPENRRCDLASFDEDQCLNQTYIAEYAERCRAWSNGTMFLDSRNRMVIAVVMIQERTELVECDQVDINDALVPGIESKLCAGDATTEPIIPHQAIQYDMFQESFTFNPLYDGYANLLDVGVRNLNPQHSVCATRILFDSLGWIDDQTKTLQLYMMVQNRNGFGRIGASRLTFDITIGGSVEVDLLVGSAYSADPSEQIAGIICITIYFLLVLLHLFWYFNKVFPEKLKWGHLDYFLILEGLYLLYNLAAAIFSYIHLIKLPEDTQDSIMDAIDSLDLTGNPDDVVGDRSGNLLEKLAGIILPVFDLIRLQNAYIVVYAFLFIFMCIVTIARLDFHPDVAFISQTCYYGLTELSTFLVVYVLVVLTYATAGSLLYGSIHEDFSSFGSTCNTLVLASMGEIDGLTEVVWDAESVSRYGQFLGSFFLWTYFAITTLILLNVLLSIVVDSYFNYREAIERSKGLSLLESFQVYIRMTLNEIKSGRCAKLIRRSGLKSNFSEDFAVKDNGVSEKAISKQVLAQISTKSTSYGAQLSQLHKRLPFPNPAYTYEMRHALSEIFGSHLADRLVFIMRRRTVSLKNAKKESKLHILFPQKNGSGAHTVDLLMRIRDMLGKESGHAKQKTNSKIRDDSSDKDSAQ